MRETIRITLTLTVVCALCAFFLALVAGRAQQQIERNEAKAVEDAIQQLASESARIEPVENEAGITYKLFDKKDTFFGYAFLAQGQGYQGKIKIMAVINPSLQELNTLHHQ